MPDAPISTIYPRFLYQKLVTLDNNFAVQTASEKIKNGVFTQYNDQQQRKHRSRANKGCS